VPVAVSVTAIAHDGDAVEHWVLRDLSGVRDAEAERRRLEAQVREAQKLESLGTLAGGVAHDFNNLLGIIRGNAELARGTRSSPDEVVDHLSAVLDASERARDLVRQILTFSRRTTPHEALVDVGAVVDDEPAVATVVERALTRIGCRVRTFHDPREALAYVEDGRHAVDIVLSDQAMPGLTGDVLAERVRMARPGLPIILVTGYSLRLTAERVAEIGVHAVLQKPVPLADLSATVRDALALAASADRSRTQRGAPGR
jgi:CheY-like chemotaxis protein